jgi:hypothetical protein
MGRFIRHVGEGQHVKRSIGAFRSGDCSRDTQLRATAIALVLSLPLFVAVFQGCSGSDGGGDTNLGGSPQSSVFSLFECSPCDPYPGAYGVAGCTTQQPNPGTCNSNCQSYTSSIENGIEMTAGSDCHTVNSHTDCTFSIGDNGVTQVDFDFTVTNECHETVDTTEWLSFWIFRNPWNSTVEADYIESLNGPGGKNGGLNANFAGNGQQVIIFQNATQNWSGHITTKFSGSGSSVQATTTNSHNNEVASSTLTEDSGYFFVMDTALGSNGNTQCSFTVSNLKLQGTVPAGQCQGVMANTVG